MCLVSRQDAGTACGHQWSVIDHQPWARAVSMAEAGQQKALLVLDASWQEVERIPLELGPRFHALSAASPQLPPDLRPGDRSAHERVILIWAAGPHAPGNY